MKGRRIICEGGESYILSDRPWGKGFSESHVKGQYICDPVVGEVYNFYYHPGEVSCNGFSLAGKIVVCVKADHGDPFREAKYVFAEFFPNTYPTVAERATKLRRCAEEELRRLARKDANLLLQACINAGFVWGVEIPPESIEKVLAECNC